MAQVKLIINDKRVFLIDERITSIGRAPDNSIPLSEDSNISRYHAEIEQRGEEYWLNDLGSSNGTTLNDEPLSGKRMLIDGDVILLGGSSELKVKIEAEDAAKKEDKPEETAAAVAGSAPAVTAPAVSGQEKEIAKEAEATSKMPVMLGVMGAVCGLAVICVVGIGLYAWSGSNKECKAVAVISNPDNGDTITEETDVQANIQNGECIQRAIFTLDNQEFASADSAPYKVSLDPGQFGDLVDGQMHKLNIVLEDAKGNKMVQQNEVLLAFETLATPTPTPESTPDVKPTPKAPQGKQASTIDTLEMVRKIGSIFTVKPNYKYDPQFIQEVQKKTAEYTADGYFARAQQYRDVINVAYIQGQNLDAQLGYILAMSRSKFNPQKQGTEEGLWRMTPEFAAANSLVGMCGTETIGDASQNCAAQASALYLKSIVLNVFEGDTVYSVAAFGMSPQEAAAWKASLPPDRTDFWKLITAPKQREEVVKFFAAAIVTENPQKFGLKKDRPLSDIYRALMGK